MSHSENKPAMPVKWTIPKIQKMKFAGEKITMVTTYDYSFARLVDQSEIEMVLVGDSLGMVIQGQKNTLPVNMNEVVYHTTCVARGLTRPLLVADMPFLSYQASPDEAVRNAGCLIKEGGAESVKMEGGQEIVPLIRRIDQIGIPVMGHIGLQPQSVHKYGGYKIQGKTASSERKLVEDAKALEEAGCWSLVLEGLPTEVAQKVTESVRIPTIGIGCGPFCDGQVLVIYDLLGMDKDFNPKFLKKYANLHQAIGNALSEFRREVRDGIFPAEENSFHRNLIDATLKIRQGN